jgi:micrococcal nuclease
MKLSSILYLLFLFGIAPLCLAREYPATITAVHDGDTVSATIELGFKLKLNEQVRMVGINAPELKTGQPGKDATEALKKLVLGKKVRLVTHDKDERDKYGRVLATIYIGEVNINELMLKAGQAKEYKLK